ncbi:MAG: FAD-binding protein [Candidatus Heimdallarchaeota archaeon]|nr:FAD-binding protein [Candidatus Heimdallarchaeota archaeon]
MTTRQVYDYIIVGSGPGGDTVAKELAEAKKKVLIVEYGPRFTEKGEIKVINKVFIDKEKKDMKKINPLIYTGTEKQPTYWSIGEKIGDAFKIGKDLKLRVT